MLALAKRGPARDRSVKGGAWPRTFGAIELAGLVCLVVGYGRIGRAIARLAAAFDMRIAVVDPHLPQEPGMTSENFPRSATIRLCAVTIMH